jgi:hypothetical protein
MKKIIITTLFILIIPIQIILLLFFEIKHRLKLKKWN